MKKIGLLLGLFVIIASCNSDDDSFKDELNANRALWQSKNISDYKWTENLACFCGGVLERAIFVVNGVKDRVDFDESQLFEGYTKEDVFNESRTIEEAFDFIASIQTQDVASVSVEYDKVYGYPINIYIDYIEDAIDDEISYLYSKFEITN